MQLNNKTDRNPKADKAQELIESHRGHYILSQSLLMAIDAMNRRPHEGRGDGQVEREPSILADMKLLYTQIFNMYAPSPQRSMIDATVEDVQESQEVSNKELADTLNGTFIKHHNLIEDLMIDAIESQILSEDIEDENCWNNYIYLETDKFGYDIFRHKDGSTVKNLVQAGKQVESQPENVISLDNFRLIKND